MTAKFKEGYHAPAGVSAEIAMNELSKIENTVGLTPANVVDASRPEDAPLHKFFLWDDSAAAEKYRQHQAQGLIRAVVKIEPVEQIEYRPFVRIVEPEGSKYINVTVLSIDQYEQVLTDYKRKLESAQKSLTELINIAGKSQNPKQKSLNKAKGHLDKALAAVA